MMNINKRRYGLSPLDLVDAPKTKEELIYEYARIFVDSLYIQLELEEDKKNKETALAIIEEVNKYFQ